MKAKKVQKDRKKCKLKRGQNCSTLRRKLNNIFSAMSNGKKDETVVPRESGITLRKGG